MSQKTFIKGKEWDLETSIASMTDKLSALGLHIEEASWKNPIPYVYSVHIHDSSCRLMFTNGKGACEKSSRASALGEFFERISCNYFFADYYLGEAVATAPFVHYPDERWFDVDDAKRPEGLLDEALWDFYNPHDELRVEQLFDLNSGTGERGICALPFVRLRDAKKVYFPVNIIGNLYVSNGMSAGNTMNEAKVQALSEICERYVKNKVIAEGICLPTIPDMVLQRFPHIKASVEAFLAKGYHLRIADASLGGVFPVVSVTLMNPDDASVFASFGAHPCFEVALERTVTELLQGRELTDINEGNEFQAPSFNRNEVADPDNLETHFINATGLLSYDFFKEEADYAFVDWNVDTDTQGELDYLSGVIHDLGYDIYIAEYSHLGVNTCRILVPGMSEIYPVDDLVWNNNNEGAPYRESILNLRHLEHEGWQAVLDSLNESEYNDMQKVSEFIGVAPDLGTVWATLQLGELKAMLCVALGEYEEANEWHNWCIHIAQIPAERKKYYRCLHALIEIKRDEERSLEQYRDALEKLYTPELVETSLDVIEGREHFYGLHTPGLGLEGFTRHQGLLEGYAKVNRAKETHWQNKEVHV